MEQTDTPSAQVFFDDSISAQRSLFTWLGMKIDEEKYPCWELAAKNIDCRRVELKNWAELKDINRPAVLTLTNRSKLLSYAVITGISENEAWLLDTEHSSFTVELKNLGPLWSGETFYVWQRPPGFKDPLTRGQRNETISWLAEQFAELDGQSVALTKAYFNDKLEQRVKIFQRDNNLTDDGIVGQQTLMKLNDALGIDITLAIEE
jgi:general secretion pathway protein A